MSATQPEKRVIPVHFPGEESEAIATAENLLKPLGYTRNFILRESVKIGLPKVLDKYRDTQADTSFTEQVRQVITTFEVDEDITTEGVSAKLLEAHADLKDTPALGNVSKVLERLTDEGVLRSMKSAGRRKIWRQPKKRSRKAVLTS